MQGIARQARHFGIGSPKDFWTGLIYIAFGGAALWIGAAYRLGTASRMGPGYFPRALAVFLIVIGAISIVRSFMTKGEPFGGIAWKPLILVLLATVLFGVLLAPFGLVVSLFVLAIVSAMASEEFRLDWRALAGLALLVSLCALVFVKGLGVPMPIVGSRLAPHVDPWLGPLQKEWIDPVARDYVVAPAKALFAWLAALRGR